MRKVPIEHFMRALSVHAYAYSFLYGVAQFTYWKKTKPETFNLSEQIWHFSEHFSLIYNLSAVRVKYRTIFGTYVLYSSRCACEVEHSLNTSQ